VADAFAPYLQEIVSKMRTEGIRAEIDLSDDRMQKKVRNAQMEKIPFMLIAGEEDQANSAVSFRFRDGSQKNGIPVDQAISEIQQTIKDRKQV
jgi:threonyl-tRNA synthetase